MIRRSFTLLAFATLALSHLCHAQVQLPEGVSKLDLTVDGTARTGFIYAPATAKEKSTPVIFVWHGHGGTAMQAGRSFAMFKHMPEAISVYLQGLNTPGQLTDPEGKKPGWQHGAGAEGDRDLKLFDTALAHLKEHYKVDGKRIFSTGHSNGGGFTYLLWQTRPDILCAVAPSAAASIRLKDTPFKPKPCMHLAGTADPLVKFEWQQLAIAKVKEINQCEAEGKPWDKECTLYPSKVGAPFVAFIKEGGTHKFPEEAPALIAKFFKEQAAAVKE
ncbi:alpha/beta hydrolase family esterase [Prosthecobacter sp.]|uniref:alpha/beta hydrolase family esterase n=1 Tax=Prosthecobacter sp. TaxID=1965333 RepID=UPI0037851D89